MSDFLKYTAGLHVLDKLGSQDRAINRQNEAIHGLNEDLRYAKNEEGIARAGAEYERKRANEYKALLSKPMAEIAEKNGDFRETYEKQQEMLASWIASQRAFKEIAMKYGAMAGKTPEEIAAEGAAAKEIVLTGQSQFGNNEQFSAKIQQNLLAKIQQEKSGKQG
ncbi:hypothetical protein [Burkholderia cenocepacia]|uniref:Uncharacterized protein n=1 Tax=Burkholderia cenocepacia TaxID=95486 RepID=A0A1V2VUT4_9BURK|nr:hypothetical protein [Burkholderia cenocepacia]ONU48818.1 hypothetical protein A8E66_04380 [Burkholderia cenocepacia]ONU49809.1 hypothetical protein A8E67_38040 [Burkholderia cenocepacia]ONU51758.1 hypothetical protein A8E62_26400 [Burkholderia cenocepacia]ONU53484.1 hypothetical protein A8E68_37290 [Burkholderia cenocepacia]ONU71915.1 hypothetical protein A8E63_40030 [Burkholderia cenocepacia]